MKNFIGIFDSGIGGLTVYNKIKECFPNENIVYLADTKNCPYGIKTLEEINNISVKNINYLKELGAKVVVVACNTATSSISNEIKNSNGSIIGVIEPTADLAYNTSVSKRIGVFATNLTIKTKAYNKYLKDAIIFGEGCSDFVVPIENGLIHTDEMKNMIKNHVNKLDDVDTLILGCTHFPYIKDEIAAFLPNVNLIESGEATSNRLKEYLNNNNLLDNVLDRKLIFLTTNNIDDAKIQLKRLNQEFDEIKEVRID